uniref:Vomeronasal type-1 receptor n=1 Tax=Bos mutus grunniens TaxID=30521 RepID=A0A8B9Y235_BOSMU
AHLLLFISPQVLTTCLFSSTKMNKNRLSSFIDIRNAFFSEVAIGILANTILLLFHAHNFLLEHRPKSTDLTIGHLALIHIVMLLTVAFMATDTFGSQKTWDDIQCKLVVHLYSSMRGLSICATCLLSVLRAITLSPRNSCLAKFKPHSSHHNLYCTLFLWVFNMFISGYFLVSTVATPSVTSAHLLRVTESCSLCPVIHFLRYVHFRQTQHLHSTKLSPKAPPEERATQTILLLMSFFVVMYFLDITVSWFSRKLWDIDSVHMCVQMLVGNGYASISPLVLISAEKRIIKVLKYIWLFYMFNTH